ncbi:MAG: phosphoribosylformylglycinamidine synthase subunit PurS [Parvibaculales bacterium]
MKATIKIRLKNGVLDPQGKAIENALTQLDFQGVDNVRQGKLIEVELAETDEQAAKAQLTQMCEKLLANTVIENYDIEIETAS